MSKKKQTSNTMPLISSISTKVRNTVYGIDTDQVTTKEETIGRKRKFLSMLDKATDQLATNLENGMVDLTTSLDMERIMKLTLLMSGEADNITGKVGTESTSETEIQSAKLSMSKIEQILDLDDPAVKEMYDKLYESYNQLNDEAGEQ